MKIVLLLTSLLICSLLNAQTQEFKMAICSQKNGCQEYISTDSKEEIMKILNRPDVFTDFQENSILVIDSCNFKIENELNMQELHEKFGGINQFSKLSKFKLEKYLKNKKCIGCANSTKRLSVTISSSEISGSSYFYISWNKKEAFMPNDAFQKLYAGQEGFENLQVDAIFKDYQYISYLVHPESGKWKTAMPIGTSVINLGNDEENEAKFKRDFRKTGNKRPHFNTNDFQYEYVGKDDEGKPLTFWLGPAYDVCLPIGKFDALGFFNLGYIAVEGITYLVAEISGPEMKFQVTAVEDADYQFNPVGYQSL